MTRKTRNRIAASGSAHLVRGADLAPASGEVLALLPSSVLNRPDAAARIALEYFAESYSPTSQSTNSPATSTRKVVMNQPNATTPNHPVERPNHSRSLSENVCQLVRPTKIISAISCAMMIHGTP